MRQRRSVMKLVISAVIIIAAVAAVLLIVRSKRQKISDPTYPRSDLQGFYYNSGGGMSGGYYQASLTALDDRTAQVDIAYKEMNGAREKTRKAAVSIDLLEMVYTLYRDNDIASWADAPESEYFALDAPTSNISFRFTDGTETEISSTQELPEGANAVWQQLIGIFKDYE